MCGILALFSEEREVPTNVLSHRGPDDYRSLRAGKVQLHFWRLAINDLTSGGMQPFVHKGSALICNGEIYNYKNLKSGLEKGTSDCEVLLHYIPKMGIMQTVNDIVGDFAFVYTDGDRVYAARDGVGVRPMFYTRYGQNSIAFASEAKALMFLETKIDIFPPGHIFDSYINDFVCYHTGYWKINRVIECDPRPGIRETLIKAVHMRLATTERDIGFLLSGGLDSSLICAIAARKLGKIKTFSIGLPDSPDLEAARKVAKFLDTEHTEVTFTVEEGIKHLRDVIHSLESYDTTTIRASTPMWLLCKYIKENTNCRYIFSGEGSDEILGGYLYFHNAPSTEQFACENMRRLRLIHQFDGLRADRCAGAHGLDLIVPFLDKHFIHFCMSINQTAKRDKCEKKILREAFVGYLPDEVLWRQKDGMSDAVGTNWVDELRKHTERITTEDTFSTTKMMTHGHNPPLTKEEAHYRDLFWMMYGYKNDHLISEIWRPKWTTVTDPSARLLIEKARL